MYERFTDRARKVMQLANKEAKRCRHEYIGTEHVLFGLVIEGSGVAANVLKNLDVDLRKIRLEVEKILRPRPAGPDGEQVVMGRLPHTTRTEKGIEYAIAEARALNHNYVGTEHLLLGFLREQEGVAAQVLLSYGLKLEDVRKEVRNLLGRDLPTPPVGPRTATLSVLAPPPTDLTPEQVQFVRDQIESLNRQKEDAIIEQDFDRAARYHDTVYALKRLLALYEWFSDLA